MASFLLLVNILPLLTACSGSKSIAEAPDLSSVPTFVIPTVTPSSTPSPTPAPPTPTPVPTPTVPEHIVIPDIHVATAVVPIAVDKDGQLEAPTSPDVVGWWAEGPRPGGSGNVLLSGHLDWAGPKGPQTAVFWRLRELVPGNQVVISNATDQFIYVVTESKLYTWDDPEGIARMKSSDKPIITLITCEGVFNQATRNYSHRRIVVAELKSSAPLSKS